VEKLHCPAYNNTPPNSPHHVRALLRLSEVLPTIRERRERLLAPRRHTWRPKRRRRVARYEALAVQIIADFAMACGRAAAGRLDVCRIMRSRFRVAAAWP
jgi:hypothetical protein